MPGIGGGADCATQAWPHLRAVLRAEGREDAATAERARLVERYGGLNG